MSRAQSPDRGFTLIEVLIVVAIVGILATLLIPNLLVSRSRGFDSAAMTCLKEVATRQEAIRVNSPFVYDTTFDPDTVVACEGVSFLDELVTNDFYSYDARHTLGANDYQVQTGTAVRAIP